MYTSANQRNKVTFVFQWKGELTNKRGEFPLKKRSLCKWPIYDCNRRVQSNFFPSVHSRFLAVFHCMNNLGHSIKKQTLYFTTGSMGGAVNRANHLQHWGFVTLFALRGNHFLPSQPCKEVTFERLEEKNPLLNGQIEPQARKAVGSIKASWLKMGLEESCEVDGAWPCISTTRLPLNSSRRRIAPVLFIVGQRLFFLPPR